MCKKVLRPEQLLKTDLVGKEASKVDQQRLVLHHLHMIIID